MGGRGASSSTSLSKEEIRQRNREYLAKRMEQGREVLRQSMQRDLENIKPYQDNTSAGTNKLYSDFVNNPRIVAELNRNIYARQSDDRNAKVGSTRLDSDRMISNYTDTLTTEEYSRFNVEKAENELFKKLRQLERKAGFKR